MSIREKVSNKIIKFFVAIVLSIGIIVTSSKCESPPEKKNE